MSKALNISVRSVETIIHDHLNMSKVSARWAKNVNNLKKDWLEKSCENLELMKRDMAAFEKRIGTGDGKWVGRYGITTVIDME